MITDKPIATFRAKLVKEEPTYTTDDELAYVNRLAGSEKLRGLRRVLLSDYLRAALNRTNWDRVDPGTVIAHVRHLLAE